jgi:hypothetical protein
MRHCARSAYAGAHAKSRSGTKEIKEVAGLPMRLVFGLEASAPRQGPLRGGSSGSNRLHKHAYARAVSYTKHRHGMICCQSGRHKQGLCQHRDL